VTIPKTQPKFSQAFKKVSLSLWLLKMPMRYSVPAILFLFLLTTFNLDAQRWKTKRYEAGVGIGTTHIFGDIGGGANSKNWMGLKDIRLDATRPSLDLKIRYRLSDQFATKFSFFYGYGFGSDKGSYHNDSDPPRDMSFNRHILEPSLQLEYYFFTEDQRLSSAAMYYRRGMGSNYTRLGLYLFTGIGSATTFGKITKNNPAYQFNPEKESIKNSSSTLVIPAGIGVKYMLNPDITLGFELGGRYCFSDYIDGYNPFGYSANKGKDIYYLTSFSAIYKLKNDRNNVPLIIKNLFNRGSGGKVRRRLNN
jgi:hypothetical protein